MVQFCWPRMTITTSFSLNARYRKPGSQRQSGDARQHSVPVAQDGFSPNHRLRNPGRRHGGAAALIKPTGDAQATLSHTHPGEEAGSRCVFELGGRRVVELSADAAPTARGSSTGESLTKRSGASAVLDGFQVGARRGTCFSRVLERTVPESTAATVGHEGCNCQ